MSFRAVPISIIAMPMSIIGITDEVRALR